jgi:hypothetical protein
MPSYTWLGIADVIHKPFHLPDKALEKQITERVARMWQRFAADFSNELFSIEYNTIKHGLRSKPGGFRLAMGESPDKMNELGGSEFGSAFFVPQSLKGNTHFFLKRTLNNWHPANHAAGLRLLAQSIRNLKAFLRYVNAATPGGFNWPAREGFEGEPWGNSVRTLSMSFDATIDVDEIEPFSAQEILDGYAKKSAEHGDDRAVKDKEP